MKSAYLVFILAISVELISSDFGNLLGDLEKKVFSYQALKEVPYKPPFGWLVYFIYMQFFLSCLEMLKCEILNRYEKQGLFKSDIRVNTHGNPLAQDFRDGSLSAVYDNDMFSTGYFYLFIRYNLLLT